MKKKLRNTIITSLFCLSLFAIPVLFFLTPKESFSEREKRYLEETPSLSAESLANGAFTEKLSRYVADHFPGREFFVGINAYFELLAGRVAAQEYFPAKDGRLFANPGTVDTQTLDENLEAINGFARALASTEADIPVTLMLVPSSGAVLLDGPAYPDEEIISYVYERAETGHVELFPLFRTHDDPDSLYYRTDHHWTSAGAFEAACAYQRSLGRPCPEREAYIRQSYEPFYGSAYAASGLWLTEPDSLELWYSGAVTQVSNETGAVNDGVFYLSRLEEQDKYTVFLDGNHSLVRIENFARGGEEERNLLVIRDSFSNCLGCFLADQYDTVILIDLRYYKRPLTQMLIEENIDEILIEYSVDNFQKESNLVFLSLDAQPLLQKVEEERYPNYCAPPRELTDEFFDGAYYLGDSVNGVLGSYCLENGKLMNTTIATNAMLSYHETATLGLYHLIYKGEFTTLPAILNDLQPRFLIAALGCNDLAEWDVSYCEEMFVEFLKLVRETDPELPIFIQSVMPIRVDMTTFNQTEVEEFNAWLKENATAYDYCYIELDQYFKAEDGELDRGYMYNATHINYVGGPIWYEQLLNIENYYNFPARYCVEYDGRTGLPVNGASAVLPEEAEPEREETELDRIYARILEQLSCPEMLELNERAVNSYLGIQAGEFLDGRFYLCANNLRTDEIWLVELEDEASARAMLDRARERIEVKAASYEKYLPEESEIARQGISIAEGRYVALFLSPEAERMREIFLSSLG